MEENKSSITYDENWQTAGVSEYPKIISGNEAEQEYDKPPKEKRISVPKQYLVIIQLILCALVALSAFGLKQIGGEWYKGAREWYYKQLNNTIIADGRTVFDLSSVISSSTRDEA